MAFSSHPLVFFSFLLVILVQPFRCFSQKGEDAGSNFPSTTVVEVSSLLPATTCSTSSSIKGISEKPMLKILHRHGPCSQFHEGKAKSFEEILLQDQIRVNSIRNRLSKNAEKPDIQSQKTTLPANSGSSYRNGNYIVHMGFGTPIKSMTLVFDTGSDITWIQCQPCDGMCYSQTDVIFDATKSTSYSNITCQSAECSLLKSATGNPPICYRSSSTCVYGVSYGDGSFSQGFFGHEKLTITPSEVVQNFKFGCGQNNQGLFGNVAGLLGLGRDKLSFSSQTFDKYGGVFSYCLPTRNSGTGYLSFGAEQGGYPNVKFTPMIQNARNPSFYFLNIQALIVGNQTLPISASVFQTSGVIIDSGTVITRLPPSAYNSLKSAFQQGMSKYPKAPPVSLLDTCYNFSGYTQIEIPIIAFVFQGNAKVQLKPSGILVGVRPPILCLAFAANEKANQIAILGNVQQQQMKVVYDIPNKRLGFGPGNC